MIVVLVGFDGSYDYYGFDFVVVVLNLRIDGFVVVYFVVVCDLYFEYLFDFVIVVEY